MIKLLHIFMVKLRNIIKHIKNRTVIKRTLEYIYPPPLAMTWAGFNLIKSIIEIEKPKCCLEWGSGFSTIHYSRLVSKWGGSWITIEHDEKWYMKALKTKAKVFYVKPNNPVWESPSLSGDGTYEDFRDYVDFPKGKYDFVLIDGRARIASIERAKSFANTIILHDVKNYNIDYDVKGWTIIGNIGIYKTHPKREKM